MDNIKKFEGFLDRMQGLLDSARKQGHIIIRADDLENAFPELKESEDERIKETLIKFHKSTIDIDGIKGNEIVDWLEKQGEQKQTIAIPKWKYKKDGTPLLQDSIILNKYGCVAKSPSGAIVSDVWILNYNELAKLPKEKLEQESTDKVEPKFKVGDWIISNDKQSTYQVVDVKRGMYVIRDVIDNHEYNIGIDECEKHGRKWTIEDAKDGDVLACENGWTCIFKKLVNDETFSSYCFMDNTKWFCETGSECHTLKEEFVEAYNGKIYPATKEQRDTLMKAMEHAGYTFDFEKKELKLLITNGGDFESENCEQKFDWSEVDDYNVQCLVAKAVSDIQKGNIGRNQELIDWLKSLKQRMEE